MPGVVAMAANAEVIVLFLGIDERSRSAAILSLWSVQKALLAADTLSQSLVDAFPDLLRRRAGEGDVEVAADGGDLFVCEVIDGGGGQAVEVGVVIKPHRRYRELVDAIARDFDCRLDDSFHDWPILSLGGVAAPSVAGGGAASSGSPEGRGA